MFKSSPVIPFYPEVCDEVNLKVLKTRTRNVVTLGIGPFCARETVLVGLNNKKYHSEEMRSLTPYRCTYGYDVLVYVGKALFVRHYNEVQIQEKLLQKNVRVSRREIGFLGKKFIAYLAIAHKQSRRQLKKHMQSKGGYILHLDGTCEGDSPNLFTGMDGIAQIVLDNVKIPSEKAEFIIPFLEKIKRDYGMPIALVHDMGRGILNAVEKVFKDVPDFICHFHFLRDIGKDLFDDDYSKIRMRLKKHKIRSILRRKAKGLEKIIDEEPAVLKQFAGSFDTSQMDTSFIKPLSAATCYAMIHWVFEASELKGYGFPFDCPHLVFYQRLKRLYDFICRFGAIEGLRSKNNKAFFRLRAELAKVVEDQQLIRSSAHMEEKKIVFQKLREVLAIAVSSGKKGLNDDGLAADIQSIEEAMIKFREEIKADQNLHPQKPYRKMIKQIDKYWDKLFADPIPVNMPVGKIMIQPQRTNNMLERFFRDLKRGNRKKSGVTSMSKTLKCILSDTPLVKNLGNPEYLNIILNGSLTLEEKFSKIDGQMVLGRLEKDQANGQSMRAELKKIVNLPDLPERLSAIIAA